MGLSVMRKGMARIRYIGLGMLLIGQMQREETGEAGVTQSTCDWCLVGKLGFKPRDSSLVVDPHKAAQALVVAAHDLEATVGSQLRCLLGGLACSLLNLGHWSWRC